MFEAYTHIHTCTHTWNCDAPGLLFTFVLYLHAMIGKNNVRRFKLSHVGFCSAVIGWRGGGVLSDWLDFSCVSSFFGNSERLVSFSGLQV